MNKERDDMRRASIKETGEELSQEEWERFDAAVAEIRAERRGDRTKNGLHVETRRERDERPAPQA